MSSARGAERWWRPATWAVGAFGALAVAGAALPQGLPLGVVLLGLVYGGLTALTAIGLVMVYRAARIVNFAQAEIGGLSSSVAVVMVAGWHLPYFLALPVGLAVAVAAGAWIDLTLMRFLFRTPRLLVTVATIGLAQVLAAGELEIPHLTAHLSALSSFTTPFTVKFVVGPIVYNGNHLIAMVVVPLALVGLALFFGRTDAGIAIRGAADSRERALTLGIPVGRLSLITWMIAAGLSAVAAMLTAGITQAGDLGAFAGPETLLPALVAAVIAGMESMPVAFFASLAIGVLQQAVFWSYPESATVDVALFAVVLIALLLQRRRISRRDDEDLGGFVALHEVAPVPAALRSLPALRRARWIGLAALLAGLLALPWVASNSNVLLFGYMAVYGILAVSLVVLTGWSGQISLGQFAFAGVGAGVTAALVGSAHLDLFLSLFAAALITGLVALVIGVPALRIPGLFLAVTTLAFAVPVSTFLLDPLRFPDLAPSTFAQPLILHRFRLSSPHVFYYLCLLCLLAAVLIAWNYRRTRAGRVAVAVRDNRRAAAAFSISPVRTKLFAFMMSGGLAGLAGGLLAVGLHGIGFGTFAPEDSLQVFTMAVIGGLGSLPGALLGAVYVESMQYFLHGAAQLLATGAVLLLVVMLLPGGLSELLYRGRDVALAAWARRMGIEASPVSAPSTPEEPIPVVASTGDGLLQLRGVDASYGHVQVLFGVGLAVRSGEILALLGTNGAGKSTALRILAGLMRPDAGQLTYGGHDISRWTAEARAAAGIATMPGGRAVFPSLTVEENLRLATWLRKGERAGYVEEACSRFPSLRSRVDTRAGQLSGGEQQMLGLAMALLCRPKVLLIDELSLGLAPAVVADLLQVVRDLAASGVTVVVVEQSLNVAASIAERAVFMERGQVRFTGSTADLRDHPDVARAVFLGAGRVRVRDRERSRSAQAGAVPALEVVNVSRSFGGVVALDEVSLAVSPGEILGIIGANGAGKTTLFDVCSGFLPVDCGHVLIDGFDMTGLGPDRRAEIGLGRIFQDSALFPSLTVQETLSVALERHVGVRDPALCMLHTGAVTDSEAEVSRRVADLLDDFGLQRYRDTFISELSTGTRRIVELAGAVAHHASVILLDEPSSGIAQREIEGLAELLRGLRDRTGATLVIIEHDISLVSALSDRLICMHLGRMLASGTPAQVLDDPAVGAAYLGTDQTALARTDVGRGANGHSSGRLIPVTEYARMHSLSPSTVRRWASAGRIDSVRDGRRTLIKEDSRS